MDAAGWTDINSFSDEFKLVVRETLEHIAQNQGAIHILKKHKRKERKKARRGKVHFKQQL